jgi:hypothetical protein
MGEKPTEEERKTLRCVLDPPASSFCAYRRSLRLNDPISCRLVAASIPLTAYAICLVEFAERGAFFLIFILPSSKVAEHLLDFPSQRPIMVFPTSSPTSSREACPSAEMVLVRSVRLSKAPVLLVRLASILPDAISNGC